MARMKLFDREIVDADQPYAKRRQILGAIGRQIRVIPVKVALADEARVARLEQHPLVSRHRMLAQVCLSHRHHVIGELDEQCRSHQHVERKLIDALASRDHVLRRVDVRTGVRSHRE